MKALPQPILPLTFVYKTLASVTRSRVPNIARATNADDHQHGSAEFGYITHLADRISLRVDHISPAEQILTDSNQASL